MAKLRQVMFRETGGTGYAKAQHVAFRLRSLGHEAEQGYIKSPAGDWADSIYVMTDAPLPLVRKMAKQESLHLARDINPPMGGAGMRYFEVELTDRDGETHLYNVGGQDAWEVLEFIARTMRQQGDFYGHNRADTIEVTASELVERPSGHVLTARRR